MKVHGEVAALVKEFKPGYRVATQRGNLLILDPDGNKVRGDDGRPIELTSRTNVNGAHVKALRAALIQVGAIQKPAVDELAERVKERTPLTLPPLSDAPEYQYHHGLDEWRKENGLNGHHLLLPAITLNVEWEELLQLEKAAGLIADRGPRTIDQFQPFLKMVERARALMERKIGKHDVGH